MQQLYACSAVQQLADRYYEKGGEVWELVPGCLGWGTTVMFGEGLKTAVIKEVYINECSSGHTIRFYKRMPKKYQQMIDDYCPEDE